MAWELYTTAPSAYDGFGTVELDPDAGTDNRGLTIRKVAVEPDHLDWQMARYASGLHGCVTAAEADVFWSIWRLKGAVT
jgi:hypothetical protein